ncbi:DUF397 domain-containing protein [Kitasatospora sp. NPDC052896]|uniref:DUF397 domain-containing protein n=1 Tax=Kitasatospora sp. NPDC052896 TaxID=3364061 RepID=UPI0037CC2510
MRTDRHTAQWRKSSYSNGGGGGGECIEVDVVSPGWVRDSKDPEGPVLEFSAASFATFVRAVKTGAFEEI